MPKQSKLQKDTVERVMHAFRHGELTTHGGRKVKRRRQAVAIGLSEAGASRYKSSRENERSLRRSRRKERRGATGRAEAEGGSNDPAANGRGDTRAALYAQARRRDIRGRSKLDRAELQRALRK